VAAWCPCGCGKKLSLIERGGAKQLRKLNERIDFLETFALPLQRKADEDAEGFQDFIDEGREFRDEMLAVIHGDLDARAVNRRLMNAWSVTAANIERNTISTLHRVTREEARK
jgi:hypothetical protein